MPKTGFRPEKNGFAFINSWQFDTYDEQRLEGAITGAVGDAVGSLSGGAGRVVKNSLSGQVRSWLKQSAPSDYGLCGGMAFSARDYFVAKIPLPRGRDVNDRGIQPAGASSVVSS